MKKSDLILKIRTNDEIQIFLVSFVLVCVKEKYFSINTNKLIKLYFFTYIWMWYIIIFSSHRKVYSDFWKLNTVTEKLNLTLSL